MVVETCLLIALGALAAPAVENAHTEEFFEKRVRPVLVESCVRCHGALKANGGLRLDSREALRRGGDSGPAVDLAHPENSRLVQAIRRLPDVEAMPPKQPLAAERVADLAAWVQAGAPWPKQAALLASPLHWAFQPIQSFSLPAVKQAEWPQAPLDHFILAKLEQNQLAPLPMADLHTLLRRATYDLTGLPPTPEEMLAFEADASPTAWERVIDRLLDSPRYGEHWGRHWLDVVRYADTAGETADYPLPHAWRYRNWVIAAFNRDLPYDEFVRQQVAGDLLAAEGPPELYAERVVATGYLALARRFGFDIEKDIHLTHEDAIDNLGKTFLGLTLGCCRCHDHKYDPLTTRDYYGLYGIFESTKFAFTGCEKVQRPRDLSPLWPAAEIERRARPLAEQVAAAEAQLKQLEAEQRAQASRVSQAMASNVAQLTNGEVDDGKSASLLPAADQPLKATVKRGDVLQLSILPRSNHGADTTLVDFEITAAAANMKWSVRDFQANFAAGNVRGDAHGHERVWCFFDLHEGPTLLPEFLLAFEKRPEIQIWRNGDTPSIFVNASDQPVKVWTTLPPRSFCMHPGPQGPVALAWISPIDGELAITGGVADLHPGGGDGVGWRLEHFTSPDVSVGFAQLAAFPPRVAELRKNLAALRAQRVDVPVAFAVSEGAAKNARIHLRGEPTELGDEAPRKFLDVLGGQQLGAATGSGRRELAQWLTDPQNPLTPRVMVNRVWQGHFGRGLVATPNDIGTRGAAPSHPELLDFLAQRFVQSGWRLKELHREILRSATWRQASGSAVNDSYVGFPRRRLSAEELRDTLLFVSGELDGSPGEAHPFPAENTWGFTQHAPFAADYDSLRRSVYVMQKRNRRQRFFALFDGADPNASTPVRDVTTVPTQALFFLNDPFFHTQAEKFAARVMAATPDNAARFNFAQRVLLARPATPRERELAVAFLAEPTAAGGAENNERSAWTALARILLAGNEVLHVD